MTFLEKPFPEAKNSHSGKPIPKCICCLWNELFISPIILFGTLFLESHSWIFFFFAYGKLVPEAFFCYGKAIPEAFFGYKVVILEPFSTYGKAILEAFFGYKVVVLEPFSTYGKTIMKAFFGYGMVVPKAV